MLSIIVPVYKVEKYLRYCLDSILKQDGLSLLFELIIVDDGSPDNCDQILAEYKQSYPQITIVTQTNQGLSITRNKGLLLAKREYIWFVDSDDTIEPNCISGIVNSLKSRPDLLQLHYQKTYEDGRVPDIEVESINDKGEVLSGKEVLCRGGLPTPAQFTIYRRQFLLDNQLKFYPGIYHEDSEFKPRATYFAKSVKWHPEIVYNYFQRTSGSIMSSFKFKNALDMILVMERLHNFYDGNVSEMDCKIAFRRAIGMIFNSLLLGYRSLNQKEQADVVDLLNKKRILLNDLLLSKKIKYTLEGLILKYNISLGIKLHFFIR